MNNCTSPCGRVPAGAGGWGGRRKAQSQRASSFVDPTLQRSGDAIRRCVLSDHGDKMVIVLMHHQVLFGLPKAHLGSVQGRAKGSGEDRLFVVLVRSFNAAQIKVQDTGGWHGAMHPPTPGGWETVQVQWSSQLPLRLLLVPAWERQQQQFRKVRLVERVLVQV